MNSTERARAIELEALKREGKVIEWWFQPLRLKLADDNAWYTPDFMVFHLDGLIEVEEIKGFWEEAALVRIKVAASRYPFLFTSLTKLPRKHGGGWERRSFKGWADDASSAEPERAVTAEGPRNAQDAPGGPGPLWAFAPSGPRGGDPRATGGEENRRGS